MYSLPRLEEFHRFVPDYWPKDDHDILADDTWPGHDPEWMKPMTFENGQKIFREQVPLGGSPYGSKFHARMTSLRLPFVFTMSRGRSYTNAPILSWDHSETHHQEHRERRANDEGFRTR